MKSYRLASSAIRALAYDDDTETCTVTFAEPSAAIGLAAMFRNHALEAEPEGLAKQAGASCAFSHFLLFQYWGAHLRRACVDINGLWTASFAALGEGTGVVTMLDGKLSGGDTNYYYLGSYQQDGARVTGRIHVVHYAGPLTNVFGPQREIELTFWGVAGEDLIMARGTAQGVYLSLQDTQLAISLRRVAKFGDSR